MIKKILKLALIFLTFSCSVYSEKNDFFETKSNINNLTIDNIENLKESKSCLDGSIGYFRLFTFFNEVNITNYAKLNYENIHEYFAEILVDKSGDISISSAAKLGGIRKIKMVDHSYSITGIMARRYCVIVYGE